MFCQRVHSVALKGVLVVGEVNGAFSMLARHSQCSILTCHICYTLYGWLGAAGIMVDQTAQVEKKEHEIYLVLPHANSLKGWDTTT